MFDVLQSPMPHRREATGPMFAASDTETLVVFAEAQQ